MCGKRCQQLNMGQPGATGPQFSLSFTLLALKPLGLPSLGMAIVAMARLPSRLIFPPQNYSVGTGTIFPQARVETFPASPTLIFNCHGIFHFNYTHSQKHTGPASVPSSAGKQHETHTHTLSQKHTGPANVPSSVTEFSHQAQR